VGRVKEEYRDGEGEEYRDGTVKADYRDRGTSGEELECCRHLLGDSW
jgi:hypothetical protein